MLLSIMLNLNVWLEKVSIHMFKFTTTSSGGLPPPLFHPTFSPHRLIVDSPWCHPLGWWTHPCSYWLRDLPTHGPHQEEDSSMFLLAKRIYAPMDPTRRKNGVTHPQFKDRTTVGASLSTPHSLVTTFPLPLPRKLHFMQSLNSAGLSKIGTPLDSGKSGHRWTRETQDTVGLGKIGTPLDSGKTRPPLDLATLGQRWNEPQSLPHPSPTLIV